MIARSTRFSEGFFQINPMKKETEKKPNGTERSKESKKQKQKQNKKQTNKQTNKQTKTKISLRCCPLLFFF